MNFLKNMFRKDQPVEQKRGADGMLLPQYWKCLVCKGGNKATWSVRANLFLMKFENKENFPEIDDTSKKEITGYVKYNFASVPFDQDASHLEDTLGILDIGTTVIDAVFLCDDHYNEYMKGSWA